ncbi:MAG: hypothetical protein R6U37_03440, partial [Dehalococcoidia bacterium]
MNTKVRWTKWTLSLVLTLAMVSSMAVPFGTAFADDAPAMGGNNWNTEGAEWQMYASGGSGGGNHEYWTYHVYGQSSETTVGPGIDEFTGSQYEETGQDLYDGKSILNTEMTRTNSGYAQDTYSPMDVYWDQDTIDAMERWQHSHASIGDVYSQVWKINYSGWPTDRDLSGGETWSYNEITDAMYGTAADEGDIDRAIDVSVASTAETVTVNGMSFSCYQVDRYQDNTPSNVYYEDYWDVDGVLSAPVKTVDYESFDNNNTVEMTYYDFPGSPTAFTCDSGGTSKTSYPNTSDTLYVSGHWVTLNSSYDDDCLYDVWVGQGAPSAGATLSTWGSDSGVNVNVGPQSGANEPGSFEQSVDTMSNLGITGNGWYVVLDEGDGKYNLDDQQWEADGQSYSTSDTSSNCPSCYAQGTTSYDDALSNSFDGPTVCTNPTVTTNAASSVGCTSATLNGNLTDMGSETSVDVNFEYGTTDGGPYPNKAGTQALTSTGAFTDSDETFSECTTYYYRAIAKSCGAAQYGSQQSFTTDDCTAPSPDPMTFATNPYSTGCSSIDMTASTATDACGGTVMYYFTCTAGGGNDSGWQSGTYYQDTGLSDCTEYTYTV